MGELESGLLNLVNPDTTGSQPLIVGIQNSTFSQNIGYSATLIYFETASIILTIDSSNFADNFAQTSGVILFQDANVSLSITNTNFSLTNQVNVAAAAAAEVSNIYINDFFEAINCVGNGGVFVNNSHLVVNGSFNGSLIVFQNTPVELTVSNLNYYFYPVTSNNNNSQTEDIQDNPLFVVATGDFTAFGLLRTDFSNANFDSISIFGLNLESLSLFELICSETTVMLSSTENTSRSTYSPPPSFFKLEKSQFSNITLLKRSNILLVTAPDPLSQGDACPFLIELTNNTFSNISSSDAQARVFQVDSSQIAATSAVNNTPNASTQQALLTVINNTFNNITGSQGVIYSGPRIQTNATTILFANSTFSGIDSSSNGAIFYLEDATVLYSSTTSTTSPRRLDNSLSDDDSVENFLNITGCVFDQISATNGAIVYALYSSQPITTIALENNTFQNIVVNARGGILHICNTSVFATNNNFTGVSAAVAGSIVYSDQLRFNLPQLQLLNNYSSPSRVTNNSAVSMFEFAPNTLKVSLITPDFAQLDLYSTLNGVSTVILRDIASFSLDNLQLGVTLYYEDNQISQPAVNNLPSSSGLFTFNFISLTKNKPFDHCNGSYCNSKLSQVTVIGDAGDIIEVDLLYFSKKV